MKSARLSDPALLIVLCGLISVGGCVRNAHISAMEPEEVEQRRADLGRVGVLLHPQEPKVIDVRPARGAWGGMTRGFVAGGATPIVIGFVTPVPGGTLIGALIAPFTAIIGGVYGATKALPAETVDEVEVVLNAAADRIRDSNLRTTFLQSVVELGNQRTTLVFLPFEEADLELNEPAEIQWLSETAGVDSILDIRPRKTGLLGGLRIDPPASAFIELRVTLTALGDDEPRLDQVLTCISEPRRFAQWGENDGRYLEAAFGDCVARLAEMVIDDFFLVYQSPSE